jgi:hypothetical protein
VVKDQDGVLTSIVFMNKNRIRDFFGDRMGWFTKCDMKPISSWWKSGGYHEKQSNNADISWDVTNKEVLKNGRSQVKIQVVDRHIFF